MNRSLTKALAALGAVLVWLPVVAAAVTGAAGSVRRGALRVDYLMPAELFPVALAGGLLLLWAAVRARSRRGPIAAGLGLMLGCLAGSQALAVATGLASGEAEPAGWPWAAVVALLIAYTLVLIGVGVAGGLLVRDLAKTGSEAR